MPIIATPILPGKHRVQWADLSIREFDALSLMRRDDTASRIEAVWRDDFLRGAQVWPENQQVLSERGHEMIAEWKRREIDARENPDMSRALAREITGYLGVLTISRAAHRNG